MKKIGLIIGGVLLFLFAFLVVLGTIGSQLPDTPNSSQQTPQSNEVESSPTTQEGNKEAINIVSSEIVETELNIDTLKLKTVQNPKGGGEFVFYPETTFSGVERYLIWLVIDNQGFALNSPSKEATPNLPFPREADNQLWERTNLDKYQTTEAIEFVFQ